ncbi:hypothetical protein PBI_SCTP2_322 [Salicola phage SCTP-2]|nr:hypothetical protein PBI_SCTP2_322 [Salicola phage SCTP-2]
MKKNKLKPIDETTKHSLKVILHNHNYERKRYNENRVEPDDLDEYFKCLTRVNEHFTYCFTMPSGLDRSENDQLDEACDYIEHLQDEINYLKKYINFISN